MIGAFLHVTLVSLKNRIVQRLRRLREPRYALGALFGLAYFGWILFRRRGAASIIRSMSSTSMTALRLDIVSVVVLAIMLFAWALPGDSGGLEFSEAEIAFLFPAPLRRRDLLLYKVIRQQPQVLTSALIFTIFGMARSWFVGLWVAFSVMSVYMIVAALGRARLRLMGANFVVRLAAVAAIAFGFAYAAYRVARPVVHFDRPNNQGLVAQQIEIAFRQPFIRDVLFIPRLFAGAVVPPTLAFLAASCLALIAAGILLFFVADRLNVSFEEASTVVARRRQERMERFMRRRGGTEIMFRRAPAPFPLRATGRPEIAIVWKNSIAAMRMSLAGLIMIAIAYGILIANALFGGRGSTQGVAIAFLVFTAAMPFIGPNLFTNDLRLDLPRLEVLKSFPLSGEQIVGAEIAAPLVLMSVVELASIAGAWVLLEASGKLSMIGGAQFAVVAVLLAVPICALQLVIRNAIPVIFPAWAARGKEDPRGFVIVGQRMLLLFGNVVALAIALIPPFLVFLPSLLIAMHFFKGSAISVALMTVPAVAVIASEVWVGVKYLGGRFEELDVSEEFDTITV